MLILSVYLLALETEEERDKLTRIYEKYYTFMRCCALRYAKDTGAEDDIVHDSILKIIDHMDKIDLDRDDAAKCFLSTVVKNKARDWWRKETRRIAVDIDEEEFRVADDGLMPMDAVLSQEGYERLVGYITELNDTYRDVCNLKYICGLKEREIAECLDLSPKNVSVRIVRGRQKLMERIRKESGHD